MKKRIFYVGNKLSKHGINQTSVETLGPLLEKNGFIVSCASDQLNPIVRMLDMLFRMLKHGLRSDYVLIDTYSTWNFWYAFIIAQMCRLFNIKYIAKLHGGNLPQRIKKSPWSSRQIFAYSYANVAPSNYLLSAFLEQGYRNTIYIPNTINLKKYNHKVRTKLEPRLLWVRKIAPIYNPHMALDVVSLLRTDYPNIQLTMVGPQMQELAEEVKNRVEKEKLPITFTGGLKKKEWIELSADFDLFINTTHFDNMPVSVMEAMALGLPVVSTNVGGLPYLIDDQVDGLLVNDNDAQAMANRIADLLEQRIDSTQLTKNAYKKLKSMDNAVVIEQWRQLLQ